MIGISLLTLFESAAAVFKKKTRRLRNFLVYFVNCFLDHQMTSWALYVFLFVYVKNKYYFFFLIFNVFFWYFTTTFSLARLSLSLHFQKCIIQSHILRKYVQTFQPLIRRLSMLKFYLLMGPPLTMTCKFADSAVSSYLALLRAYNFKLVGSKRILRMRPPVPE